MRRQHKMEKVRRTMLPANHQAVFGLKVGEVSEVITDPNGGHYIYKSSARKPYRSIASRRKFAKRYQASAIGTA